MDLDHGRFSIVPESSKEKSRQHRKEGSIEEKYYTIILDADEEGGLDLNTRITLLNQHTQKLLLVITTKEKFLNNVQKFMSLWLDTIFGLTNSFFNLRDKNDVLSNNKI